MTQCSQILKSKNISKLDPLVFANSDELLILVNADQVDYLIKMCFDDLVGFCEVWIELSECSSIGSK